MKYPGNNGIQNKKKIKSVMIRAALSDSIFERSWIFSKVD